MKVGIPKEVLPGETRVAIIPESVKRLVGAGLEVNVERGAGAGADFSDEDYEKAGATVVDSHEAVLGGCELVLKIRPPAVGGSDGVDEVAQLQQGTTLITFLNPFGHPELLERLARQGVTACSMELIPRITRAQNMDALSSMATVAGYKAVLMAADSFHRFFPMFMTAAGTIRPARVLVLGAGVAGLQAIATARRLGGVVEAFDTRPVVKEQVESLGAKFIALDVSAEEAEGAGGYAKELAEEHHRKELELISGRLPRTDVIVTTAQVPGKAAPVLLTTQMVQQLKPGSIIVDLAAENGGNCELTRPGEVVREHGVTMIGTLNLPALMPVHASEMYSKNLTNLVTHLVADGQLTLNLDDEITAGVVVTHRGQIVHPALKGA